MLASMRCSLKCFVQSLRYCAQLIRGIHALAHLQQPIITLFGGAESQQESPHYQQVYLFAQRLASKGFSVVTGGGPGIMQAANCGAMKGMPQEEAYKHSLGIAVHGIDDHVTGQCAPIVRVDMFFQRKWLLVKQAAAVVVFPGGLGTADELFYLMNLYKHDRLPRVPVVLVDRAYWEPLVTWLKERALPAGYIKEGFLSFFVLVDTIDEAFAVVQKVAD